jgi:hypothetical protein
VSFLLPNESVAQEIVGQVQQLLEGSTESAGLRAMSADELDWSRAEVLLLDGDVAEGEEVEALLVIPAVDDGAGGQALWGRTKPSINTKRALYVGVIVKKQPAGGSPRYQVTSKTPIANAGSAVPAKKPLVICPYRYYGQTAAYRSLLCQWWEGQAITKINRFFLERSLDLLPELFDALQGENLNAPGITSITFMGPDGNLILTKPKDLDLDPETMKELYERLTNGDPLAFNPAVLRAILEGLGFALDIIGLVTDLQNWWDQQIQADRDYAQDLVNGLQTILIGLLTQYDVSTLTFDELVQLLQAEIEDAFEQSGAGANAVEAFMTALSEALQSSGLLPEGQDALGQALEMMATFMAMFVVNGEQAAMEGLIENFGPFAVIAAVRLRELSESGALASDFLTLPSVTADCETEGIQDPVVCLLSGIDTLLDSGVGNLEEMMQYLAAAAYQVVEYGQNSSEGRLGLEAIARVTILSTEIFPAMVEKGWNTSGNQLEFMIISVPQPDGTVEYVAAFYGKFLLSNKGVLQDQLELIGFIEPYLEEDDINSIIAAIDRAIDLLSNIPAEVPYVVQIIDKLESEAALNDLCANLPVRNGVPVVVMYPDGTIPCFSNTDEAGALLICRLMGRPNCNYNPGYIPPGAIVPPGSGNASSTSTETIINSSTTPSATCNKSVVCLLE